MSATATLNETVQRALDDANPNEVADALQKVNLGTVLTPLQRTFTGLVSQATQDLTAIDATGEAAGGDNPQRLAALSISTLRVTAGTAAAADRQVSDSGGTPSASVATLSDDGTTLTFEAALTAFVITYIPRAAVDMTEDFADSP